MKRALGYIPLAVGILAAGLCWAELLYRLRLYVRYGAKPFVNHVADGYFGVMYLLAAVAAVPFVVGTAMAIGRKSASRTALYVGAMALVAAFVVVLCLMHRAGVLVTYSEFVDHAGL